MAKARHSMQDARAEAQSALQEIQAAKEVAAGKSFPIQRKYAKEKNPCTYWNLRFPGEFTDLPRSISDAPEF